MSVGKVAYRFLPNGAKSFDKNFRFRELTAARHVSVITDINGKRAIGSYIRNSNTLWNELICGDRCNFLAYGMFPTRNGQWHQVKPCGNAVTQNKGGWAANSPPPPR